MGISHRLVVVLVIAALGPGASATCGTEPERWTLGVEVGGQWLEGTPLRWSERSVVLLGRDGKVRRFSPAQARRPQELSTSFSPFSTGRMRSELEREFGKQFEVTATGQYLVVHPVGQGAYWAGRFDRLNRSMRHYFAARGQRLAEPEFPLVAIVAPSRAEFLRLAAQSGGRPRPGTLGFYSPTTNRVLLYDQSFGRQGKARDSAWRATAATIIHEATHQTAFNCGVHRRLADTPVWVVEGLATMFEALGVHDAAAHPGIEARINAGRLRAFRAFQRRGRPKEAILGLIASDQMFRSDPSRAYAEAWALSFFLAETRPRAYFNYLRALAGRKPFAKYDSLSRVRDFQAAFGADLEMLDARLVRFIDGLPK